MAELVSILIPGFKPRHLRECLDSALKQTWPNTEIILSDDCKTDEVRRICADYEPRVQYVRNPNPGISGHNNMRHLCHLARGKYLKFLLDDDLLHPECVRLMVEAMERTGSHLAFSPRRLIDEHGNPLPPPALFKAQPGRVIPGDEIVHQTAKFLSNRIGELTTVMFLREDVFDHEGRLTAMEIDGEMWLGLSDVALYFQLAERGPAVMVNEELSSFRKHAASNSNAAVNPHWFNLVADWKLVLDYARHRSTLSVSETGYAYLLLILMLRHGSRIAPSLAPQFKQVMKTVRRDIMNGAITNRRRRGRGNL